MADFITGFPIVYRSPSLPLGFGAGQFVEMVSSKATHRTLTDVDMDRAKVDAFLNHETSKILASTRNLTLMLEDVPSKGLRARIEVNHKTSYGNDAWHSWVRGDLRGWSFAFQTVSDEWWMEGEMPHRLVTDMKFSEVTLTPIPAYPATENASVAAATSPAARSDRRLASEVAHTFRELANRYREGDLRIACRYREDGSWTHRILSYGPRRATGDLELYKRKVLLLKASL